MTILYHDAAPAAAAGSVGYSNPEASAAYIATLGLLHLVKSLIEALDDLDYRVAAVAERINQAGLPPARLGPHPFGIGSQFGLFSLLPEPFRSAPERDEAESAPVPLEVAPRRSGTSRSWQG